MIDLKLLEIENLEMLRHLISKPQFYADSPEFAEAMIVNAITWAVVFREDCSLREAAKRVGLESQELISDVPKKRETQIVLLCHESATDEEVKSFEVLVQRANELCLRLLHMSK